MPLDASLQLVNSFLLEKRIAGGKTDNPVGIVFDQLADYSIAENIIALQIKGDTRDGLLDSVMIERGDIFFRAQA